MKMLTNKQLASYQQRTLRSISKRLFDIAAEWEEVDGCNESVLKTLAYKVEETRRVFGRVCNGALTMNPARAHNLRPRLIRLIVAAYLAFNGGEVVLEEDGIPLCRIAVEEVS